jgi:hypothetical protein
MNETQRNFARVAAVGEGKFGDASAQRSRRPGSMNARQGQTRHRRRKSSEKKIRAGQRSLLSADQGGPDALLSGRAGTVAKVGDCIVPSLPGALRGGLRSAAAVPKNAGGKCLTFGFGEGPIGQKYADRRLHMLPGSRNTLTGAAKYADRRLHRLTGAGWHIHPVELNRSVVVTSLLNQLQPRR